MPDAKNQEFSKRLRATILDWKKRHDGQRLSHGEIGRRVAERMGRGAPFSHVAVGAWVNDGTEPSYAALLALADVLEVDVTELLGRPAARPAIGAKARQGGGVVVGGHGAPTSQTGKKTG